MVIREDYPAAIAGYQKYLACGAGVRHGTHEKKGYLSDGQRQDHEHRAPIP